MAVHCEPAYIDAAGEYVRKISDGERDALGFALWVARTAATPASAEDRIADRANGNEYRSRRYELRGIHGPATDEQRQAELLDHLSRVLIPVR